MKILAIRGKNLASLEGEFVVDFTEEPLQSAGIFAITGQTGSGKSTLLDALCLALFDKTPRNNRATENINIADVNDKTITQKDSRNILRRGTSDGYAEVDFMSLSGERYRSRWSVARARNRVEGSLQKANFSIFNLNANIEIQGGKTDLLAKIVDLIGLTFDQFTRAVLLAQGDFATFLKATQSEKAELLEKLTGTDIYSRISASIYEKTKYAENDLAKLNERIKDIDLLTNEELDAISAENVTIINDIELLKAKGTELATKIKWITDKEILNNKIKQAQELVDASQKAIEEAKPRYDYLAKIDSLNEIRDSYGELKRIEKQIADNNINCIRHEGEREANILLVQRATENITVKEAEQKQHHDAFAIVETQIKQARALDIHIEGAKKNVREAKDELTFCNSSKMKVDTSIETTKATIIEIEQKLRTIATWIESNVIYKEIITRIDLIINILDDATIAKNQGASNAKILDDSKLIVENNNQSLIALKKESERLNTLLPTEIVTLRSRLVDGTPCPVCGSLHHPMSMIEGDSIQEEELNRAKQEVENKILKLTDDINRRNSENIRLQSIIDNYAKQYSEGVSRLSEILKDLPTWKQQFDEGMLQKTLQNVAKDWGRKTEEQTKLTEQITSMNTTLQLQQKNLIEIEESQVQKKQKYMNCENELSKYLSERSMLLSGKSADEVEQYYATRGKDIAEYLTKLNIEKSNLVAKGEKITGIITQITEEIKTLSQRNIEVCKIVDKWIQSKNGAITINNLVELLSKDTNWLTSEREELNHLRENEIAAKATLAERLALFNKHCEANIKPSEEENKDWLEELQRNNEMLFEQKTKRNTEIEIRLRTHAHGKERIRQFEKELEEKRVQAENWKKLNEMFGSADGTKFKVLAQGYTLDALLTYANRHLQELSKRYELQRITGTLALQVVDLDMLGEVRTVHSLSGGESFLISLALALGLSSLSSNKMKVESLFIDEGFGSLDIETLRTAMDALESLQTQGRKIGVISHVAEMTERISTQIRVIKTTNGRSKIEVV